MLVIEGDTVIAITRKQQRKLNVLHIRDEFCTREIDSLYKVVDGCENLIEINKNLIRTVNEKDSIQTKQTQIYDEIIKTKDENIETLKDKNRKKNIIGAVIGGVLTILVVVFAAS